MRSVVVVLAAGCFPAGEVRVAGTATAAELLGVVVDIPGGTFQMGSPTSDSDADSDEFPQHTVTLSAFQMMEAEVGQKQYEDVMGENPSFFGGCARCPVEEVWWEGAVAFAEAVSTLTGECWRLPTEAEWEYAGRGGEDFAYAGSDDPDAVAWTSGNADAETHPRCELGRNGYDLCDLSGNVWEWTSDRYGDYGSDAETDPQGPSTGSFRVSRGGCWNDTPAYARVAERGRDAPGNRYCSIGFRLVRSIP